MASASAGGMWVAADSVGTDLSLLRTVDSRSALSCGIRPLGVGARRPAARTLLDLRGAIPAFIHISDGKLHYVNVLDMLSNLIAALVERNGVQANKLRHRSTLLESSA